MTATILVAQVALLQVLPTQWVKLLLLTNLVVQHIITIIKYSHSNIRFIAQWKSAGFQIWHSGFKTELCQNFHFLFYKLGTMIALRPEQRLSIDITVQKCYLHKGATKLHMSYIVEQRTRVVAI